MNPGLAQIPQWRGSADTNRVFRWLCALSLLVHLPFTPLAGLLGLLGLMANVDEIPVDVSPLNAIPLSIIADERPPAPEETEPVAVPDTADDDLMEDLLDEMDEPAPVEPEPVPVVPPEPEPEPEAEVGDAGAPIADPVALSGEAGKLAEDNANVRLLLHTDRIRDHWLGPRMGALLGATPQWKSFFAPTGLDPIADIDKILITGPQFRDSSQVAVVVKYNVSPEVLRGAIDKLLRARPERGGWGDAGAVQMAQTFADRASRLIILPAPGIALVVPPSAREHALSLGSKLSFPQTSGPEAMVAHLFTPWRALMGLRSPVQIPKSIQWARFRILPVGEGARIIVEAEDETPELAETHAAALTRQINAVTQVKLGVLGALLGVGQLNLLGAIDMRSDGVMLQGTIDVTRRQLMRIFGVLTAQVEQMTGRRLVIPNPSASGVSPVPAASASGAAGGASAAPTSRGPRSVLEPEPRRGLEKPGAPQPSGAATESP